VCSGSDLIFASQLKHKNTIWPQTHTDPHRQGRFLSPVDLTGEKPSACGGGLLYPPEQMIHHTLANIPAMLYHPTKSCAQRAELLPGQVARAKKHSPSAWVCVGLWLISSLHRRGCYLRLVTVNTTPEASSNHKTKDRNCLSFTRPYMRMPKKAPRMVPGRQTNANSHTRSVRIPCVK